MKHLQKMNEWIGQRFITGHGPGEKKIAKERIAAEIDDAIQQYEENSDAFVEYDVTELRELLLRDAKENGYRGSIDIREPGDERSSYAGKKFILYDPVTTGLQDTGSASASGYQKMMPR